MIDSAFILAVAQKSSPGSVVAGLVMMALLIWLVVWGVRKLMRTGSLRGALSIAKKAGSWMPAVWAARKVMQTGRLRRAPLSPEDQALASATEALDQSRRAVAQSLRQVQSELDTARRHHAKAVSAAEKRLKHVQQAPCLGRVGKVKVYEDRIETPEGVRRLDEQVHAVVESAGVIAVTRRHTLTRFALIGVFSLFTPKATTHDNRELYLLVEHPQWASLTKLDANKGVAARKVCATLNLAARQASANRTARTQTVESANRQLADVSEDQSEIRRAESSYAASRLAGSTEVEQHERIVRERMPQCEQASRTRKRAEKALAEAQRALPAGGVEPTVA